MAFVFLGEFPRNPEAAFETYRRIMESMSPDVIVISRVIFRPDQDPAGLHQRMRQIAVEYAKRMERGWDESG